MFPVVLLALMQGDPLIATQDWRVSLKEMSVAPISTPLLLSKTQDVSFESQGSLGRKQKFSELGVVLEWSI